MDQIVTAITAAFTYQSLVFVAAGVSLGYFVGVVPGLGRGVAIAVAIPLTFYISPISALGFLLGVSKGTAAGSAVSAILLNTPGEPSSAATCIDGYPLAKSGQSKKALQMGLIASVVGDLLSTLVLIAVAEPIARVALEIGPFELTAILVFALTFIAGLSGKSLPKGLIAGALGMLVACVGIDIESGQPRFIFGQVELLDGVPIITVALGTLALSEMFVQFGQHYGHGALRTEAIKADSGPSLTRREMTRCVPTILRGSSVGVVIGALPGLGASVASFLSYALNRRLSSNPSRFGRGALEGVAAAEAADNAMMPASLIPLFTLGIPGSVAAALLIGAFMIHGVTPGPLLFRQHADFVYSIYASMIVASFMMLIIGWFGSRFFAMVARAPMRLILPVVVFFCFVGNYLQGFGHFGAWLIFGFAVVGWLMKKLDFSFVTFLIGFIVTPIFELSLRQSLVIAGGDWKVLLDHPIAIAFLIFALISAWHLGRRPGAKVLKTEVKQGVET